MQTMLLDNSSGPNLENVKRSLFFTSKGDISQQQQQSEEQNQLQDDFIKALLEGDLKKAITLEKQGISWTNNTNGTVVNDAEAFTKAIGNIEDHIIKLEQFIQDSDTLQTHSQLGQWYADNADKPWTEKYDNDCLEKEGLKEWWASRWTRRKSSVETEWIDARFENISKEESSIGYITNKNNNKINFFKPNLLHAFTKKPDEKNLDMSQVFINKLDEKNIEKQNLVLKTPSLVTHYLVLQNILALFKDFRDYLETQLQEKQAMSISCSL